MSQDVVFQARLFGMAVLWGSGLMLAYDCLRMLRMMIRQRKGIQAAEEAVFWLLAAGCLFTVLITVQYAIILYAEWGQAWCSTDGCCHPWLFVGCWRYCVR